MSKRQRSRKHKPNGAGISGGTGSAQKPNFQFSGDEPQRFSGEKLGPRTSETGAVGFTSCSSADASCSSADDNSDDTSSSESRPPDGEDETSGEDFAAAAQRFQIIDISRHKHPGRLSEANLDRMRTVPVFLLDIVEEVTQGNMAFDLRGQLKELRIVFDPKDDGHAVIAVYTEGFAVQTFNLQLDEVR